MLLNLLHVLYNLKHERRGYSRYLPLDLLERLSQSGKGVPSMIVWYPGHQLQHQHNTSEPKLTLLIAGMITPSSIASSSPSPSSWGSELATGPAFRSVWAGGSEAFDVC